MEEEGSEVTTDPKLPGFQRIQTPGKLPYYRTPFCPEKGRRKLSSARETEKWLQGMKSRGYLQDISVDMFSFRRKREEHKETGLVLNEVLSSVFAEENTDENTGEITDKNTDKNTDENTEERETSHMREDHISRLQFMVNQMTVDPDIKLDHQAELSRAATELDGMFIKSKSSVDETRDSEEQVQELITLKEKISQSESFEDIIGVIYENSEMKNLMVTISQDICFSEVMKIDTHSGPLVNFPSSVNSNLFCDIVKFGMKEAPKTTEFLFGFIVKKGQSVRPSHVIKLATSFASLAFAANRKLDALAKLRSLTLHLDSLTNRGLEVLSSQSLTATAKSLCNLRDTISAVGPMMTKSLSATKTTQSAVDNCDVAGEHLTVEFLSFESRTPTCHLDTAPLSKTEALKLFQPKTVLLCEHDNLAEKEHLLNNVIAVGVGRILYKKMPDEAKVLGKYLPRRHQHSNSSRQISPAQVVVSTPYPYMETKNADTVLLCIQRQRNYLSRLAEFYSRDPSLMKNLAMLEDCDATEDIRVEAEQKVMAACREYGENISHGDLLTVAMFENAKLIMSGSVTAFGRLEFLGIMRLGLLHLKMKMICAVYQAMMPDEVNFEDEGCLAWLVSISNKTTISNRPKDIKKDDSSFEHHDQVKLLN